MALIIYIAGFLAAVVAYLWQCERAISTTHPEAAKLAGKRFTQEQIQEAYKNAQTDPIDVRKFLPPKLGRRYIVTGGSGGCTSRSCETKC